MFDGGSRFAETSNDLKLGIAQPWQKNCNCWRGVLDGNRAPRQAHTTGKIPKNLR